MQRNNMASPLDKFDYKDPNYQVNEKNFQKVSLHDKPMSFEYKNNSFQDTSHHYKDEKKMTFTELVISFTFIHQGFMVCFFAVVLFFKWARASFSRCMMVGFGITNLINSIIYIVVSSLFFVFVLFGELIGQKFGPNQNSNFLKLSMVFVPIVMMYAFYGYWSALFVRVAKEVGDSKAEEAQVNSELVREPMN